MSLVPEVIIKIEDSGEYGERSRLNVYVDGERIGGGRIGGEPEDNVRLRDYKWVETTLAALATKLGGRVQTQVHTEGEED